LTGNGNSTRQTVQRVTVQGVRDADRVLSL